MNSLEQIAQACRDVDNDWSAAEAMVKLNEETGELAEAVLVTGGRNQHKTLKEPLVGEVADVIICAVHVMSKAYPSVSARGLSLMLEDAIATKQAKWIARVKVPA